MEYSIYDDLSLTNLFRFDEPPYKTFVHKIFGKNDKNNTNDNTKILTVDILKENIHFSDYFKNCKNEKSLKVARKKVIALVRKILENAFDDKTPKVSNFSTCQLGHLVDLYNEADIDLLENVFLDEIDKEYASLLKIFNKTKPTSKKRSRELTKIDTEKLEIPDKKLKK